MSREELRLLLCMARRPLSVALTLILLALLWLPALGYFKREREAALATLGAALDSRRQATEKLARDVGDLERLRSRYEAWRQRGLIAGADRQAWFEAQVALIDGHGKIELREPVALTGIDGAWRHPFHIELAEVLDTEALALARRFEKTMPVPWRLERIVLKEPGQAGLAAIMEGALVHVDPEPAGAASPSSPPSDARKEP